jgi:hypothetical protein
MSFKPGLTQDVGDAIFSRLIIRKLLYEPFQGEIGIDPHDFCAFRACFLFATHNHVGYSYPHVGQ